MSALINYISNHKLVILAIMFSPLIMYLFGILINASFNLGTYLGTYIRTLISISC